MELDQRAAKAAEEAAVAASAGEPPVPLPVTDSLISAADSALLDSLRSTALEQKFGVFQTAAEGKAEEVILGNKRMEIRFSTLGARPVVMRLKEYQTYRKTPLLLADPDSGTYELKFIAGTVDMSTEHLYFSVASKDSDEVVFQAATADQGKFLRIATPWTASPISCA
ncbi:MAG: hypothetical protein IPP83_00095 [Flavobacteriales bacterium]|nr:hypothetical protein [Flavobacteriales bacterium]